MAAGDAGLAVAAAQLQQLLLPGGALPPGLQQLLAQVGPGAMQQLLEQAQEGAPPGWQQELLYAMQQAVAAHAAAGAGGGGAAPWEAAEQGGEAEEEEGEQGGPGEGGAGPEADGVDAGELLRTVRLPKELESLCLSAEGAFAPQDFSAGKPAGREGWIERVGGRAGTPGAHLWRHPWRWR